MPEAPAEGRPSGFGVDGFRPGERSSTCGDLVTPIHRVEGAGSQQVPVALSFGPSLREWQTDAATGFDRRAA